MDIPKTEMSDGDIIEKLADYAHEAWSGWMRYLFSLSRLHCEGVFIPERLIDRWMRQMSTPYQGLSESEKESDRAEARKMLAIIRGEEQSDELRAKIDQVQHLVDSAKSSLSSHHLDDYTYILQQIWAVLGSPAKGRD